MSRPTSRAPAERRRPRFCLVTSAHVCNNPRLVKEADALHESGCDVRVVAVLTDAGNAARDDLLMARRAWRLQRVRVARRERASKGTWLAGSLAQLAARRMFEAGFSLDAVRDQAASRFVRQLASAAASEPADVVIGHTLGALPAAARAAARLGARVGFDLEDLHSGELPDDGNAEAERRLVVAVERRYLPRCDFLVASSEGIADAVVERYGVARPFVLHNVFPAADRVLAPAGLYRERENDHLPSLYWYSQVIGAGRGLEEAVAALPLLHVPARLYLRGIRDATFVAALEHRAERLGVRERVVFRDPAPPEALVALATRHDIGLALEQPGTLNRRLCATNKLFTYLLGGLAIAATDTPGQRAILERVPDAGFLYAAEDAVALASGLNRLLASREILAGAKRAALAVALERYSWERERGAYVEFLLAQAGGRRAPAPTVERAREADGGGATCVPEPAG